MSETAASASTSLTDATIPTPVITAAAPATATTATVDSADTDSVATAPPVITSPQIPAPFTDPAAATPDLSSLSEPMGQLVQTVGGLITQLLSSGGARQSPDGSYAATPYNTPLQGMLKTLGVGDPTTAESPGTASLVNSLNSARTAMGTATGPAASAYHDVAGRLAAQVPGMQTADLDLVNGVNAANAAVGGGRQQMMGAIDGLNTAMSAIQPLMGTATGQAGAAGLISSFIQVGISILTQVLGTLAQTAMQNVSSASEGMSGMSNAYGGSGAGGETSNVEPAAFVGPSSPTGAGPEEFKKAMAAALDAHGITDPQARANWTAGYEVLVGRESGFNPAAINLSDSNAASGNPSQGYTQTIPSTFEHYHQPGTSMNITDGAANIAASMNYVMDKYDVSIDGSNLQANVQQADPNRAPKGY